MTGDITYASADTRGLKGKKGDKETAAMTTGKKQYTRNQRRIRELMPGLVGRAVRPADRGEPEP